MLRLIGQEFCPIPEFAKVARTDAAFSAEILRFANSPIIAMRFEVVSILHAISVLGLDRLRSLVLTLILRNLVVSARANEMLRASWRHNFACALACEWMAAPCDVDAATAYTAGLLHEVGRMALTAMFGQRHLDLIRRAAKTSEDLEALERHEFGTDQFDAGKQLAEEWALPEVLQAAICQRRPDPGGKFGIPNLVSVACVIADQAGFSLTGQPGEWDSAVIGAILPDAAFERLVPRLASMKDEIPFKVRSFESEFLSK